MSQHHHAHTDHDHDHGHAHAQSHAPAQAGPAEAASCCSHGCAAPATTAPSAPAEPLPPGALLIHIPAMDCSAEESEIRRALEPIAGLRSLRFDLGRRTLALDADAALREPVLAAIRATGFEARPLDGPSQAAPKPASSGLPRLALALLLALASESADFFAPDTLPWRLLALGCAAAAILLAGFSTYRKGLSALRLGRLNINALMTVAVTGAFVIGQWPEAAMVMALYAIAELIEARAVDRARNAIQELLALAPQDAEVRQPDGSWRRQPSADVAVGALVRLRPGERVPLDGEVVSGQSAVDQAPVTGESIPVDKGPGDGLYAGTINQGGALEFRVSAPASDSLLARIIHAVEVAQGSRAPTQRFVDRFAAVYTPAVFAIALAVAVLTPWLLGWGWSQALYKALVLLVIACPCALVISTPVTVVSGLAAAARRGILIKGGVHLEEARKLKAVALDKTGTITQGRPQLAAFEPLAASTDVNADADAELGQLARSLALRSDHPVSAAIAQGLQAGAPDTAALAVDEFRAEPGRGVQGRIDGRLYRLANHRWVEELGLCSPALEARLQTHEQAGRSLTLLVGEHGVLALCAVADTIKDSSRQAIAELRALGVTPVMLTGDNAATARAIAEQAGITELQAQLLPEEKLAAIEALQARLGPTAMTGDGINDAPALARADLGFAMGGAGTHTAMEAADVVVMNDDLRRLPETLRLSQRTHAVLWQNIALALGIKAVFLVAAVFGNASMWMAVFADMGASLLVVFNGLRLLRPQGGR